MPRCIGEAIIPFPVLHDAGCAIASRYGVAFSIPAELRALHLALGFPKPARDSPTSWKLPIPATYIVGITGRVVLSYLDVDYTTRLAPADIIAAMTHLQAKSVSDHSPPSDRQ